ncbi:MAG: hypothetical protein K8S62_07010 [Candidatus Sabulitectum sp.]|nr:hypothetical protein [Candidatus Sabulitectum sp.]
MKREKMWTLMVTAFLSTTAAAFPFTAHDSIEVHSRPYSLSAVWSVILPGETVMLEVRTASGWLGFDPGVAQAANTCSFRYRWLAPDTGITAADSLPVVWAPRPDESYAMIQEDTPVFSTQDTTTAPLAIIPANSAAALIGLTAGWLKVDLSDSPDSVDIQGWILSETVSIN